MAFEEAGEPGSRVCVLLLVDCSFSMTRLDPATGMTLADSTSQAVNRFLATTSYRATRPEIIDIDVIGYGASVASLLSAGSQGLLVRLGDLSAALESPSSLVATPPTFGATPMVAALKQAELLVRCWAQANPNAAAPIVVNITDGASTDGDPRALGAALRSVATTTGPLELCTVELAIGAQPNWFPAPAAVFPADQQLLTELASELSDPMRQLATQSGHDPCSGSHACVIGADADALSSFLDIVSSRALRIPLNIDQPNPVSPWRNS